MKAQTERKKWRKEKDRIPREGSDSNWPQTGVGVCPQEGRDLTSTLPRKWTFLPKRTGIRAHSQNAAGPRMEGADEGMLALGFITKEKVMICGLSVESISAKSVEAEKESQLLVLHSLISASSLPQPLSPHFAFAHLDVFSFLSSWSWHASLVGKMVSDQMSRPRYTDYWFDKIRSVPVSSSKVFSQSIHQLNNQLWLWLHYCSNQRITSLRSRRYLFPPSRTYWPHNWPLT